MEDQPMRQKTVAFIGRTGDRWMEFPHGGVIKRANRDEISPLEMEYSSSTGAFV